MKVVYLLNNIKSIQKYMTMLININLKKINLIYTKERLSWINIH